MLLEANLTETFWREAVGAAVYIINGAQLRVNSDKTPYELWTGRKAIVDYFKIYVAFFMTNRRFGKTIYCSIELHVDMPE